MIRKSILFSILVLLLASFLLANEIKLVDGEALLEPSSMPVILKTLNGDPSNPFGRQLDTLFYDDGTAAWIYQGASNALWWAVRFTPSQPCTVKASLFMIYLVSGSPPVCTLAVWDDVGGTPGAMVDGPLAVTSTAYPTWSRGDFSGGYYDTNDFWVGCWLPWWSPGDSARICTDANPDYGSRQAISADGSSWTVNPGLNGDLMIRAIVEYGGAAEPDIDVTPDTLEFILTDSKGSREAILHPSPLGRQIDTLIYDDGTPDAGYYWGAGARMASRMSPAQPCTILTLQYYCWSIGGNETIDATIYDWTGSAPGSQIGSSVSLPMDATQQWYDADFSPQNLAVSGDFIASFNMNNDQTVLGFDYADNGRAWDYDGSSWSQWTETYFIRAIVDYGGGAAADTDTVQIMMINNVGSEDLIVDSIIPADTWIVSIVPNSFTVPPGNGQNVTVTVTRDALPNGVHYSSLAIWSNDPDENPYIEPVKFTLNLTAVEETETPVSEFPYGVKIFPNPMSTNGTILYSVPSKTDVKINIYDIAGRLVRRLVNGEVNAGSYTAIWDRKDANGVEVTQGVYLYNFITPGYKNTGKITVIR